MDNKPRKKRIYKLKVKCIYAGCDKEFNCQAKLLIHANTHTGCKPFECDICGKSYFSNGALTAHKIIHTGVKKYNCEKCGKFFIRKLNRDRHKCLNNLKYECQYCTAQYKKPGNLVRHLEFHHSDRRKINVSGECGIICENENILDKHLKNEHNKIRYYCNFCDRKYLFQNSLLAHMQSSHDKYDDNKDKDKDYIKKECNNKDKDSNKDEDIDEDCNDKKDFKKDDNNDEEDFKKNISNKEDDHDDKNSCNSKDHDNYIDEKEDLLK